MPVLKAAQLAYLLIPIGLIAYTHGYLQAGWPEALWRWGLCICSLLWPFKGILQGNRYAFQWINFLLMIPYLKGFTGIWVAPTLWPFWLALIVLTTLSFVLNVYYLRLTRLST